MYVCLEANEHKIEHYNYYITISNIIVGMDSFKKKICLSTTGHNYSMQTYGS